MAIKPASEIRQLVKSIFVAAGAEDSNAEIVANHLTLANVRGVYSHGVWHTANYVNGIKSGRLKPNALPEILQETACTALFSGNWGFGHVSTHYTMEYAISKAREQGIALVSLVQTNHIGRLGTYAEMAASAGMVAQIWASGFGMAEPGGVPYGGAKPVLHTNPVAMGFPAGENGVPIIIDYATTASAASKISRAKSLGQQLPPNTIVDKDGNPTTEPDDYYNGGALLSFGGHKGSAIMLACELFGRVLAGSDDFLPDTEKKVPYDYQGVTIIVAKADLFHPLATFTAKVDDLERRFHETPPAAGFTEVLVPGDLEARAQKDREANGVPIDDDVWESLTGLAESYGLTVGGRAT